MISEIWSYGRGKYKGYTEDWELATKIMRWTSVERCCVYYHHYPNVSIKGYDFIFPSSSYNRIASELGLPKKSKSSERVRQGKKIQKLSEEERRIAQVKTSILTSTAA